MKVAVVGAGAWGTALASLLGSLGHDVSLWAYEGDVVKSINRSRRNELYLPEHEIPGKVTATKSLVEALEGVSLVLNVVPTQFVRRVWKGVSLKSDVPLVSCSKGIEQGTLKLVTDVLDEVMDAHGPFLVLSGPSFAEEVMLQHPTNVTLASTDRSLVAEVAEALHAPWFRLYGWHDPIGVQVAGALKNVMAIASGVVEGMGFGHNTRAALITRGLSEMARIGAAMGADPMTFLGLAGVGDLVLTCTGGLSRNKTVGFRLGRGESLESVLSSMNSVAEGVATAKSAYELKEKLGVDAPLVETVYSGLYLGITPKDALERLLSRALKEDGVGGATLDSWAFGKDGNFH